MLHQRNAFKWTIWFEWIDILREMGEPDVRVVVVTGGDHKCFVAGADILEMGRHSKHRL